MIGWIILCCVITAIVVFFISVEFTVNIIAAALKKKSESEREEWIRKIMKM